MSSPADTLCHFLDGRWHDIRAEARKRLSELPPPGPDLSTGEHRALVFDQLRELAATGYPSTGLPEGVRRRR